MARPDDIKATEKLLHLIRQGQSLQLDDHPMPAIPGDFDAPAVKPEKASLPPVLNVKQNGVTTQEIPLQKLELELERTTESSILSYRQPPDHEVDVTDAWLNSGGNREGKRIAAGSCIEDNEENPQGAAEKAVNLNTTLSEEEPEKEFFIKPVEGEAQPQASSAQATQFKKKISLSRRLIFFLSAVWQWLSPRPAAFVVGIDIQPDVINLAKVRRSGGQPKLVDCLRVPFPAKIGADIEDKHISFQLLRNVPWFLDAFKNALTELCPPGVPYEIWCTIANGFVETYSITLPRLAPREIANAVYWSAKKEANFDDKQVVFDYAILGEIIVKGQSRISSVVYLASRAEVDAIAGFFSSLGCPLTGITTQSTAIQNQLRDDSVTAPDESVSHLHLGDQQSFIDVFTNGQLTFRRDIKTGLNSFTDPVFELAQEHNLSIDEAAARAMVFQEDLGLIYQNPHFRSMLKITDGEPVLDLPALGRLVRQLQRTFSYCATNFNVTKMSRILVSGLPGASTRFIRQLEHEAGIGCTPLDPFQDGMLMEDGLASERKSCLQFLVSALGLTLSDTLKTQNFLCTYQEKEKRREVHRLNRIIAMVSFITCVVLFGVSAWEQFLVRSVSKKMEEIKKEIAVTANGSSLDTLKSQIIEKIREAKDAQRDYQQKSVRFSQMALAREYSKMASSQIKFTKVSVVSIKESTASLKENKYKEKEKAQKVSDAAPKSGMSPPSQEKGDKTNEVTILAVNQKVTLEGIISAEERLLDFVLADLLQRIADISYSTNYPVINSKVVEKYSGGTVLHFVVSVDASPFNKKEHSSTPGEAGA